MAMESYITRIRSIEKITHDVVRIQLGKPDGYTFIPGQATEVVINKDGWREERRPFTFTSLPHEDYLEFTIKTYPSHHGVTNELLTLRADDELILHEVWGAISYKGEGVFIAGGAGITPFLSIFRYLHAENRMGNNRLIFANKTSADIIQKEELEQMLGNNFINILSDENSAIYAHGLITEQFLRKNIPEPPGKFYVCGPPQMMDAIQQILTKIGVSEDSVVVEL